MTGQKSSTVRRRGPVAPTAPPAPPATQPHPPIACARCGAGLFKLVHLAVGLRYGAQGIEATAQQVKRFACVACGAEFDLDERGITQVAT